MANQGHQTRVNDLIIKTRSKLYTELLDLLDIPDKLDADSPIAELPMPLQRRITKLWTFLHSKGWNAASNH